MQEPCIELPIYKVHVVGMIADPVASELATCQLLQMEKLANALKCATMTAAGKV